jgi:hypothetical protein
MLQPQQGAQNQQGSVTALAAPGSSCMSEIEELPSVDGLLHEELTQVYNNYNFTHHLQNSLLIMAHKQKVSEI